MVNQFEDKFQPRFRAPRTGSAVSNVLLCLVLLSAVCWPMAAGEPDAGASQRALSASEPDSASTEKARIRSLREFAREVQQYEAIGLIADCVLGSPPFQIPMPGADGEHTTGPGDASPPACVEFVLDYPPHGGFDATPGIAATVLGIVGRGNGFSRGECYARMPNWRARGLGYEPIGLTMVVDAGELRIYQPHKWTNPELAFDSPELAGKTNGRSPVSASLDDQIAASIANSWVLRDFTVNPSQAAPQGGGRNAIVAVWERSKPWLYLAQVSRAEYEIANVGGHPVLRSARIFGDDSSEPVASVRWEQGPPQSSDASITSRMILEVHENALTYSDGAETLPVALPRRVVWSYEHSSGRPDAPAYPAEIYIETVEGNRVMSLRTKPSSAVSLSDVSADPRVPLEGPSGDCRWEYYEIMRRFFDVRRPSNDESAVAVREFIEPCRNLIDMAIAANDADTEIASRRLLQEIYFAAGDKDEWYAVWNEFIEAADGVYDSDQMFMEYGWMSGYLIQYKQIDELTRLIDRFADALALRLDSDELIQEARLFAGGSGYVQATAAFGAVLVKSSDSMLRQEALLGKAAALSALVESLARKDIPPDQLLPFASQAEASLAEFDSGSSRGFTSEDIARCRSAVARTLALTTAAQPKRPAAN